jgi:hypothetical protein
MELKCHNGISAGDLKVLAIDAFPEIDSIKYARSMQLTEDLLASRFPRFLWNRSDTH